MRKEGRWDEKEKNETHLIFWGQDWDALKLRKEANWCFIGKQNRRRLERNRGCTANRHQSHREEEKEIQCGRERIDLSLCLFPVICGSEHHQCSTESIQKRNGFCFNDLPNTSCCCMYLLIKHIWNVTASFHTTFQLQPQISTPCTSRNNVSQCVNLK